MSNLQLILDEPSATFYPLSPVGGQLIFESADSVKVKDITVKLCGKGEVKFSEEINGKHEIFCDEQIIIEKDFVLWSHDEKLAAGKHDFSFKFILPEEFDVFGDNDLVVEEVITVSPMTYISTNSPVICTTTFNNVSITACIPYRIFNLNDEIPLSVEIANFSNFAVESIEAGLCWSSTFNCFGHSDGLARCETVKGELDYANSPFSVPAGATLTFNQILKSTATLPSVTSCSILSHNYLVFVRIHFVGATEHVQEFFIPIILSNIAFHKTIEGGETMLPSESVESGTFPKVTVPQNQVEEQNKITTEMPIIDNPTIPNGPHTNCCSGNVSITNENPLPTPESLHV
uniref:Arrestin-like N-terminal domain-containing protein n=1 Tax=Panagrolaimus sp. ES5 TaxID=591445 RepID=A0AC34FBS0_9BILA